jgi:hypothetical protein
MKNFDVAVIGAGIAGLTCAQQLHQAGVSVVVLDKSRGLGGRLATRRLHGTHADHGVCYLKPKTPEFQALVDRFIVEGSLRLWSETIQIYQNGQMREKQERCYASPFGLTAIAKSLATGLTILPQHRAIQLSPADRWIIHCEDQPNPIQSQTVVVAIPAPQAADLLKSVQPEFWPIINAVEFAPCITAIAVYPEAHPIDLRGIVCLDHSELGWIGFDSTKQVEPAQPVVVIQSNAAFARHHLDTAELQPVGQQLCDQAAAIVAPWLSTPEVLQVHRWRYAFPTNPLDQAYLSAGSLFCTGDWCSGDRVEQAYHAGLATAAAVLGERGIVM